MNDLRTAAVRRTARKVSKTSVKHQAKPRIDAEVKRFGVCLAASVLCGLAIASFHPVPVQNAPLSSGQGATEQKETVQTPEDAPKQTNPLFAADPTWVQDFTHQKNGLPDSRSWNVLVGPAQNSNKEQQYYTSDLANLRVENGALRLIATHGSQPEGYAYGSARLETQGKQSFLYGRIDITAKLPRGVGTWPAVWLLPATDVYAQKSPASNPLRYRNGGEIDMMEAVGFEPGVVYGVAHTLSDLQLRSDGTGSFGTVSVPSSSTSFNTYTLLWTPTKITFAVNDKVFSTYARKDGADYTTWPFDQPFYLIANLAVGGTWGGMDTAHFPKNGIDDSALPASLDIRSIYYYPYVGSRAVK